MALVLKDRVKVTATSTGTGTFTLGTAATGFQGFSAIGANNTTYYTIVVQSGADWEVGIGTVTESGGVYSLSRDTVLESSSGGTKVNFPAGTKDVFVTYPAERAVYLNAAGSAVDVLDVGTLGVSTANITTANITAGTVSTTPASGNDLVNKTYVDNMVSSGITYHTPVKYEVPNTTGNLNATYNNGTAGVGATLTNAGTLVAFTPDGVVASAGDRILVYNQTNAFENGVYTVTTVGNGSTAWVLTRATDANTYGVKSPTSLGEGDAFFVTSGNTGAGETYVCNTQGTITFGTTAITFVQVSDATLYTAGTGLTLTGTEFSITPVGTAGTYGSASQVPVFVTNASGQVTSVTNTSIAIAAGAVSGLAPSATTDTTNAANITSGTLPSARLTGSYTGVTGVGTLAAGTWNASVIGATFGGTGQSSYTQGDLLYATSSTTVGKLADVVSGNALLSGGVGGDPAWGKVGLQTHVDGTLQVANGGTGATTLTGYVYGNGTGAMTASTTIPNSATTATSANTANAIVARDASGNFSAGTITATLSGNATSATSATSATTATNLAGGVAGAVPYQSGSGTTAFSAAGTTGQVLTSNGTSAPTWSTPATVNNGTLTMAVSGTGLSGSATFTANQSGNSTFTVTSNATNLNNPSTLVARDGSGNFSAGTITATLSGTATQVSNNLTLATSGTGLSGSATFNGASAQTFTVTSNATNANTAGAIVARDGSGNFSAGTITATLSGNASTATSATTATTATNQSGGTVNATTGAFSGAVTLSGGTANGVAYLNGSNVLTTGTAFVFNGSNLGLAVTPSAWGSEFAAMQYGFSGAVASYKAGTTAEFMHVISNAYNDNANWRYIRDGAATRYEQNESVHRWYTSASGTTGNVVTFTQAMTLLANGNLGINATSPGARLHVDSGASAEVLRLNSTSDTYIQFQRSGAGSAYLQSAAGAMYIWNQQNTPILFGANNVEQMRLTTSGLSLNPPSGTNSRISLTTATNSTTSNTGITALKSGYVPTTTAAVNTVFTLLANALDSTSATLTYGNFAFRQRVVSGGALRGRGELTATDGGSVAYGALYLGYNPQYTTNVDTYGAALISSNGGEHLQIASNGNIEFSATGVNPTPYAYFDSSGLLYANNGTGSNLRGFFTRAWVNFNGTGTVAIRASGNVSSITDNGVGDYTINFTTAMPDANYAISVTGTTSAALACGLNDTAAAPTASAVRIITRSLGGSAADSPYVYTAVFR